MTAFFNPSSPIKIVKYVFVKVCFIEYNRNMFAKNLIHCLKRALLIIIFSSIIMPVFSQVNSSEDGKMSRAEAQVAREKLVSEVNKKIDKPYEEGASGPSSFDNAGFVCYAASVVGQKLPKNVKAIYNDVKIVADDKKELGDLVFFKSKGSSISTVGIFLGGETFIAAVSSADGGEDCVSVFSLSDEEWHSKYMAVGQFLPSGKEQTVVQYSKDDDEEDSKAEAETKSGAKPKTKAKTSSSGEKKSSDSKKSSGGFSTDDIVFDFTAFFDWSLLSPRQFVFRFRGTDAQLNVNYTGWLLEPGFGVAFRYNYGLDTIQIPVTFSMRINDYIRIFAGPVFTIGSVTLIDTDKQIKASIFPGSAGISFITPPFRIGAVEIKGVQDISYTIYNNLDGATLSFMESLAAGFVMYTGVRVAFPLSAFGI